MNQQKNHKSDPTELTDSEISMWTTLIHNESGIKLGKEKAYLIQSRLTPLLSHFKITTFSELYTKARNDTSGDVIKEIVSAITTHETSFFREQKVFGILRSEIIPSLIDTNDTLRIWSAACSSGQEVYTLAIICKELPQKYRGKVINILGTDICAKSIARAHRGVYTDFELNRGLSTELVRRYFSADGEGNRVCESLKALVEFKNVNLFEFSLGSRMFDLILCRNVAIYFSLRKREELYRNIAENLRRGGVLVLGATESLVGMSQFFATKNYGGYNFYVKI